MDYDLNNVRNLTISKRFRQIPIADVDFYNLTAAQATLMVEGRAQNYYINGFHHFTGIIKRVDKDDNKPIWHVHSEGAGSILRDTILNIDTVYKDTVFTNILLTLLPDNWDLHVYYNGIDYTLISFLTNVPTYTMPKLWYHITPGSALSHLSNICRLMGFEWEVDQSVSVGDVYGNYIFRISTHLGSTDITTSYVNNTNCFNLIQKQNQDKVYTSIQAVGSSPESARMVGTITADSPFTQFSTITTNESYLTAAVSAATTIIPVADNNSYSPPCIIAIDKERMCVGSKSGSNLIVTARGWGSVAAIHSINADVLNLTEFRFSPDVTLPANNGSVNVGSEENITYQAKSSGRVYTAYPNSLGRNFENAGALAYAHHKGAVIRPYTAIPAATSYASLNGTRQVTVDAMGSIDKDGVDLKASIILTKTATSQPYGSFYSTETDVWKEVTLGDAITVTQAATWINSTTNFASHLPDGTTNTLVGVPCKIKATAVEIDTRIIGITWNQYKPVFIEYGDVDMFILDDFANAAKAYNTAINRNSNTTTATVYAVDPNDPNSLQIPINGVLTWCKKA